MKNQITKTRLRLIRTDELSPEPVTEEQAMLMAAAELLREAGENIRRWLVWYEETQVTWRTG